MSDDRKKLAAMRDLVRSARRLGLRAAELRATLCIFATAAEIQAVAEAEASANKLVGLLEERGASS